MLDTIQEKCILVDKYCLCGILYVALIEFFIDMEPFCLKLYDAL